MALKALKPCSACRKNLTRERFCDDCKPVNSRDRYRQPWSKVYTTTRWRAFRKNYLNRYPLCVQCDREGRTTAATVVDHIKPHRGDEVLLWAEANMQPLCKPCHDQKTARGQ